jgi:hypothetical protein
LPLLVARVFAQNANDAAAADDFALLADLLDAGADLHSFLVIAYPLELFLDAAARWVVLEDTHDDGVPFEQPDDAVS